MSVDQQKIYTRETVRKMIQDLKRISGVLDPYYLSKRRRSLMGTLGFGAVVGVGAWAWMMGGTEHWLFLLIGILPLLPVLFLAMLSGESGKFIDADIYMLIMIIVVAVAACIGGRTTNTSPLLWLSGLGYFVLLLGVFANGCQLARSLVQAMYWPKARLQAIAWVQQSDLLDEVTREKALASLDGTKPDAVTLERILREQFSIT